MGVRIDARRRVKLIERRGLLNNRGRRMASETMRARRAANDNFCTVKA